jgi:tetratricopeptide (TPR) repeat protein
LNLGQALSMAAQRDQAEAVYRAALVEFNNDAVLLTRLAQLCEAAGRVQEAVHLYRAVLTGGKARSSAVRLVDNRERVALRLGYLYLKAGRRGAAETLWRDYITRHPQAVRVERALRASYLRPLSILVRPAMRELKPNN